MRECSVCVTLWGMKTAACRQLSIVSLRLPRSVGAVLVVGLGLLFAVACSAGAAPDDGGGEAAAIYDFPIVLYQGADAVGGGDALMLSDLRGQPVALNFWAGLCPPCRAEMPDFQRFADDYAGRVLVVGVDLGQFFSLGSQDDAKALLNDLEIAYPAGYTDDASVVRELLITGLPATLFITADGALHRKWIGALNEEKLVEIADEMLAQSQ